MSSDIHFNVASWFPGNVHVKPYLNTQWEAGCVLSTLGVIHKWHHFFPPWWPLPLLRHHFNTSHHNFGFNFGPGKFSLNFDLFLPKKCRRHLWTALNCHLSWKVLSVSWFMQTLLGIKVWWGMKLLPRFMVYLLGCTRRNFYSDKIVGPLTRLMLWIFNLTNFFVKYCWSQASETKSMVRIILFKD